MFDSVMYSPEGSSVLLDGVVGGATGISTPRENMTQTQREIIILCIHAYMSFFCLYAHACLCSV